MNIGIGLFNTRKMGQQFGCAMLLNRPMKKKNGLCTFAIFQIVQFNNFFVSHISKHESIWKSAFQFVWYLFPISPQTQPNPPYNNGRAWAPGLGFRVLWW